MAWNISAGAIRNPIPPILLILALAVRRLDGVRPPADQPAAERRFRRLHGQRRAKPGAAPAEMETQITQRIEAALTVGRRRQARHLHDLARRFQHDRSRWRSTAISSRAVEDARDAINRIRSELPADISEPVITRLDAASQPIGYYAVDGEGMTPQDISWFIDNDLQRELLAVPGVSRRAAHGRRRSRNPRRTRSRAHARLRRLRRSR